MRHPIEKSPRDGTAIILEDDASGTYDVAHWSTEAGEWLGENGEPTKITPTALVSIGARPISPARRRNIAQSITEAVRGDLQPPRSL